MRKGAFEGVCALFAEGVEVEALDAFEIVIVHEGGEDAEAGAGGAGIVDFGAGLSVFGVDAEAGGDLAVGAEDLFAILLPLGEGIEDDMIGDLDELGHFGWLVGGGEDVDVATEVLGTEAGFEESARGGSGEVVAENGVNCGAGEGLLGEEDFSAGFVLNVLENAAVMVEGALIEDVGRRRETAFAKRFRNLRDGGGAFAAGWNWGFYDKGARRAGRRWIHFKIWNWGCFRKQEAETISAVDRWSGIRIGMRGPGRHDTSSQGGQWCLGVSGGAQSGSGDPYCAYRLNS